MPSPEMLIGRGSEWDRQTLEQMIVEHGLAPEWQQVIALQR
jgi:hypothetical protein